MNSHYAILHPSTVPANRQRRADGWAADAARALGLAAPVVRFFAPTPYPPGSFEAVAGLRGRSIGTAEILVAAHLSAGEEFHVIAHEVRHCAQEARGFQGDHESDADAWEAAWCRVSGHCSFGERHKAPAADLGTPPSAAKPAGADRVRNPFRPGTQVPVAWARENAAYYRGLAAHRARGSGYLPEGIEELRRKARAWERAVEGRQ